MLVTVLKVKVWALGKVYPEIPMPIPSPQTPRPLAYLGLFIVSWTYPFIVAKTVYSLGDLPVYSRKDLFIVSETYMFIVVKTCYTVTVDPFLRLFLSAFRVQYDCV